MAIDSTKITKVKTALDNTYEKKVNKKTSISGSYTGDNDSFPTILACLNKFGELVTSWSVSPADTNYPSEKLVKDSLDLKVNISDIVDALNSTSTSAPLSANQGKELASMISSATSDSAITITKQATAETGYASTYVISQGGVALSPKINIEKDKMLRSASIETVGATPTQEEASYNMVEGDQYIKLVVNTTDNDGATNVILPISDVFDLQKADESTLTLSNAGVFSIKSSGVDTTQLKDSAVTTAKINDSAVTTAKINDANVTYAKLATACITSLKADADGEINQALDDLAEAIYPTSS